MEQQGDEWRTIRLEETESTNLYLKGMLLKEKLVEGTTVVADFQTGGRGQMGNTWFSSKGENLLFSMLIHPPKVEAREQFIISRIASLAVKNTLGRFAEDIRIKWPNDIYWRDRKITGMLIENDIEGRYITNSVIGIGMNVNEQNFPVELPNPVSLRQVTGLLHNRDLLLAVFRREFFAYYDTVQKGYAKSIEEEYMRNLYRGEGHHWYEDRGGRFMASIEAVLPSGHLVLRAKDGGVRTYTFKEVAFVA